MSLEELPAGSEAAAPARIPNLIDALLAEIERVVAKRERWKELLRRGDLPVVSLMPGLVVMTAAIEAGKEAIGSNNIVASLQAHHDLKGFDDE